MPDWLAIALTAVFGVLAMIWLDGRANRRPARRRRRAVDAQSLAEIDIEFSPSRTRHSARDDDAPKSFWGRLFDGDGEGGGDGGGD